MPRKLRVWVGLALTVLVLAALTTACKPSSFTLRLHLKQGDVFLVQTTSTQHIQQEFMGQKMSLDQTMTFEYTWEVTKVAPNGNMTIKVTYTRVAMGQDQNGQKRSFDSANKEEPSDFFKGFDLMVGKSFSVEMTPQGKVVKVIGLEDMLHQIAESANLGDKEKTDAFYQALVNAFGEDAVTEQFNDAVGSYPDQPLKVGSTWENTTALKVIFPLEVHATYTVQSWKGNEAVVAIQSTLKSDPSKRVSGQGSPFDIAYDLTGTQQGTLTIDLNIGLLKVSQIKQHVEGKILLLDPESKDNTKSIPVPVTMDIDTKITLTKQK